MTDDAQSRADRGAAFRKQWRLALSAKARQQRSQRGRRRPVRQDGAGMVRVRREAPHDEP